MSDINATVSQIAIVATLLGGQGPKGDASGPLGANSVGAAEIVSNAGDLAAVRDKLGITGQAVTLTGNTYVAVFEPRPGDSYVLNGQTLTIGRMADSALSSLFTGTGTVIIFSGLARPEWFQMQPLRSAAGAVSLGGGGTVALSGRYASEFTDTAPLTFGNVRFLGAQRPTFGAGYASLEGGAILEGPVVYQAHNVAFEQLGVDAGATLCGSGAAREGLKCSNPGQLVGRAPWTGIRVIDVVALCKNATAPVHAVLLENVAGATARRIQTVYGETGFAAKARDSVFDDILARGHSTVAVLDKSDTYAPSGNNQWKNCRARPLVAGDTAGMRVQAATQNSAGHTIDGLSADGCTFVLSLEASGGKTIADVSAAGVTGDGLRFYGVQVGNACYRVSLVGWRFNNVTDVADGTYGNAIDIRAGADVISVSAGQATNTAGHGIRNEGTNVLVTTSIAVNPGSGKVGFRGEAGSMKVPALSNIGTTSGSVVTS